MPRRIGGNPSGVRWIAAGSRPREIVALIGRHGGRGAPVHASCPLRGAGCARCRGHRARRLRRHKCCAPARWASRRPAALAAPPHRTAPALPNRRAHADADTAPNVHAPAHSAALAPAAVTPGGTDGQPRAHHADERPLADWERDDNRAIGTWPPPVAAPPCEGSGRSAPSPVTGAPSPTSRARSARCSRRSGGRPRPRSAGRRSIRASSGSPRRRPPRRRSQPRPRCPRRLRRAVRARRRPGGAACEVLWASATPRPRRPTPQIWTVAWRTSPPSSRPPAPSGRRTRGPCATRSAPRAIAIATCRRRKAERGCGPGPAARRCRNRRRGCIASDAGARARTASVRTGGGLGQ